MNKHMNSQPPADGEDWTTKKKGHLFMLLFEDAIRAALVVQTDDAVQVGQRIIDPRI